MNRMILLIAVVFLVAFLAIQFPYAIKDDNDKMRLAYLGLLFSIVALGARRIPFNQAVKYSLIWLAIGTGIIFAFTKRDEIMNSQFMAVLNPNRPRINSEGNVTIQASADGHFHVEARVDGVPIDFMIDTGASDISLSRQDAQRIGIDTDSLNYSRTYHTANGVTGGAAIKLKRLQIANFILDDFPATVNEGELDVSLLGMSALRALGGFRIDGDKMVIGKEN